MLVLSVINNPTRPNRLPSESKTRFVRLVLWLIALTFAIWFYYLPIDRFPVEQRSEFRQPSVALAQKLREAEIEREVQDLLQQIKALWKRNYADYPMGELNPPATPADIAALEHRYGPLPLDYKAFLKLHDGQNGDGGFYGYQPLVSCRDAIEQSVDTLDIGKDFDHYLPLTYEDLWFHPGVLFIAESDGGGYVLNASNGAVYRWDHDGGPLSHKEDSFTELLKKIVRCLKANNGDPHASWFEDVP